MAQDRPTVNVFDHLQPRYLDQKLERIQGNQFLVSKRGLVIEGSSICSQYSEWSELISNFSNSLTTLHSVSIQWISCYLKMQKCAYDLCSFTESAIPDFSRSDHFDESAANSFTDTLNVLIIHAKDKFQHIISQASSLLEKRESSVKERDELASITPRDTGHLNKMDNAKMRLKQEIRRIDTELTSLYSNACSLTNSFMKEMTESLQTAFSTLIPRLPFSQQISSVVSSDPFLPPQKPKYDFDSLLQSAFSTNNSCTSSVAGDMSRRTSVFDASSMGGDLSRRTSMFDGSLLSPCESGCDDFPLSPSSPVPDGILITNTVSEPVESVNEDVSFHDERNSQYSFYDIKLDESRNKVLCSTQQSPSFYNLLPAVQYDVIAVEATSSFLLLLTSRGAVLSLLWDQNDCPPASGLSDIPSDQCLSPALISSLQLERAIRHKRFTSVACGSTFSAALASTGEVYLWGEGTSGELGLGELTFSPQPKICLQLLQYNIVKIVCGSHHVLALDANGSVFVWGSNTHGELGLGDTQNRNEPTLLTAMRKLNIVDIAAGNGFSVCIDHLGRVYCFGCNEMGQCAMNPTMKCLTPTQVQEIPSEAVSVSCGESHCMALCSGGEVVVWGCGLHGEIGVTFPIAYAMKPQVIALSSLLETDERILLISAGGHRCGVVTSKSRVLTWGENDFMTPSFRELSSSTGCIVDLSLTTKYTVILHDTQHETLTPSLMQLLPSPSVRSSWRITHEKKNTTIKTRQVSHEWALQQRQLTRQWTEILDSPVVSLKNNHLVSSLLEKGIPPNLRVRIWPLLIGNVLKITPEVFEIYRNRALGNRRVSIDSTETTEMGKEGTVHLIDEDLKRTFVPLGFFGIGEPMYAKIRELLLCYAYYRPDIGYVQGMSFIAGILALHIPDSYLCFQCLANLLGSEHLIAFYSLKPSFMKRYYEVFDSLFITVNSSLYSYFAANSIQTEMFLFKWLQSLFAQCFSIDITSRVLDHFLYEGTSFLFRTAFSILKLLQPSIMKMPVEECFTLLTGSVRMESVWKETITMDSLMNTIQKIKFNEKQQQMIQELVDNAFFYEDKEETVEKKTKRKTVQLSKDEVRRALSTVF